MGNSRAGIAGGQRSDHARRFARVRSRSGRVRPDSDRRFNPQRSQDLPETALLANRGTMARSVRAASEAAVLRGRTRSRRAYSDRARRVGHDVVVRAGGTHRKRNPNMKLNAVVFDWAGTVVDHGSRAPV